MYLNCAVLEKTNSVFSTMKQLTYLVALLLLCIQQECIGVPVEGNGVQYIYSYLGYIDTRSSASDERIARWSLTGNLTAQRYDTYWILQLDNLKTCLFNGPKLDVNSSRIEDIPSEADILKQPFIMHDDTDISFNSDEPLWSVNLKRGIASNFQEVEEGETKEISIFGLCDVFYDVKDKHNAVKTIRHDSCKYNSYKHKSNVRPAPAPEDFKPIQRETVVNITRGVVHGDPFLRNILSVSKINYKPMPKSPNSQHVDQYVDINFLESSTKFERINTDKLTEKISIIYQYEDEPTHGRHKYESDSKVLVQQFLDNYDKFENFLKQTPIENHKNTVEDPVENMFLAMYNLPDEIGFKDLREKVENKVSWEIYSTFMSLLPYIGTNQSVKYIYDIVLNGDFELSPTTGITLLSTFPGYINQPTNELVQSLEGLLNVENVQPYFIKNGRILSFASVVARAIEKESISEENLKKYQKLYHDKYLESGKYEQKMMYLLGLVNMAQGLSTDFIISIIKSPTESANLRSLALAGFKNKLEDSDAGKIFDTFWPLVQNKEENFDVRVAALDLILSSEINEEQFNTILAVYKKYQVDDIYGKHLANYFLTTIESYQNKTGYLEPIGNFATKAIENEHFPVFYRPWTTGNYRLSYSDPEPNIGSYIQAKLIANPVLNTISTVQLSYNNFALSFDTGVYTLYLKLEGVSEYIFKQGFFKYVTPEMTVPELLAIIKEFDFKLKKREQDFHFEVVVFVNGKAVYGASFNNENYIDKFRHMESALEERTENTFSISYPVMDYTHLPSILGTPILIMNDMQEISNYGFKKNDLLYRSSWYFQTWLESYNPILDTTVASYKYYGDEIGLRTKASINLKNLGFAWAVKENTFNRVWDNLIGTAVVDEDILKRFCPDCEAMHEIPTSVTTNNRLKKFEEWGLGFNYTIEENDEDYRHKSVIEEFTNYLENHHSNADAFPFAKPLLGLLHFRNHQSYFRNELQRGSYRSVPDYEDGIQTLVKLELENQEPTNKMDAFEDTHNNYSMNVMIKNLEADPYDDEDVLNKWFVLLEVISTHNHTDEHGNEKVKITKNFYSHNFNNNATGFNLCGTRVELLPAIRSNKFSLEPAEETTAVHIIRQDYMETSTRDYTCSDNTTITLSERYFITEGIKNKIQESAEYKECQKDSKGLKFIPPTTACLASFIENSQYDHYKVHAEFKNVNDMDSSELDDYPIFEATKLKNNELKYSLLKSPFHRSQNNEKKFFEYITYFPYHTKNPAADAYGDNDIISGLKRACIATPNTIRTFTGHNIPSEGNKQVAFVECNDNAMRGLTVQKISNTQVGFTLWLNSNKVEATVQDDKLKLILNGELLQESYVEESSIAVRFLDKNVVFIADERISVYYNTEYIYIKANPVYSDLLCGVCSKA